MKKMIFSVSLVGLFLTSQTALAQVSNLSEQILVGRTASIGLSAGTWTVKSNLNPTIIDTKVNGQSLSLSAINPGISVISVCESNRGECLNVSVSAIKTAGAGNVLGQSIFPNGQLLLEKQTVYMVHKNTKTGFTSLQALSGLGYKTQNIATVAKLDLPDSGYLVSTQNGAHPWGSWILKDSTAYFVHELGLIPVPSAEIFYSNGGNFNLAVSGNAFDFQKTMLPLMQTNDSRLK